MTTVCAPASEQGRGLLKPIFIGVGVALGIATGAAAVIASGYFVSAILQAEAETDTAIALATSPDTPAATPTLSPVAARFPTPEMELAAAPPPRATVLALAAPQSGTLGDPRADELFTGALGTPTPKPKPPPPALASVAMYANPPSADDAKPASPPKARARLASLNPSGDLGMAPPQEEPRPLKTAIYDITAQAVYLPNGEKLEAHSGLGGFMDDPRHVHRRMRGATPPNTYRLTMRESLFHGVRAIRMTPEDDGTMYGRAGILAHTYMLGPNGQSNGCVSFKDYPKFLNAFLRGEVDRMVVVTRMTKPPAFYARTGDKAGKSGNAIKSDNAI